MTTAAPAYLAPTWRYAGDTWVLTYVVYETPPVFAADGVTITTAGVPQPVAGYTVSGTLAYHTRCPGTPSPAQPGPITLVGAVSDPVNGIVTLTLAAAQTVFPRQAIESWGDPRRASLIAQPRITDPTGVVTTIGLQPLFVF